MAGKREKVLFLDIDEVFTTSGKPGERKIVPKAVEKLRKAKEIGYTKFEFITARSGKWALKGIVPHLKRLGLLGSSEIYCENGLYKIVGGKFELVPEAEKFKQYRQRVAMTISVEIKKRGIDAANASAKAEKVVQVRFEPNTPEAADALKQACTDVVARLKREGKIPLTVYAQGTTSGVNIFPRTVSKGSTARAIERRIFAQTGRKVSGKAFGDQPVDKEMSRSGVKWRYVKGVEDFMRAMDNLTFRRPVKRRRR